MKKSIFLLIAILAVMMFASAAFAAGDPSGLISGSTSIGGAKFSPSNGVSIDLAASSQEYAAVAKHEAGDTYYFTEEDSTGVTAVKCDGSEGDTISSAAISASASSYSCP